MESFDRKMEIEGILVVDKPAGWTSFDVVRKVKRLLGIKKVGHTGTLDPMATGVLPLCLGRATKISRFITEGSKVYEGTITFGIETDTYDVTGKLTKQCAVPQEFNLKSVQQGAKAFCGKILQTPPPFSAVKHKGMPLYKWARKGVKVQKEPREVFIKRFDILWVRGNEAGFRVECSKGTYVRSLVHDLGRHLKTCACLKSLKRVESSPFKQENAHTIEEVERAVDDGRIHKFIIPVSMALDHLPQVEIDQQLAQELRYGRPVPASRLSELLREQSVVLDDSAASSYLRLVLKAPERGKKAGDQQLVSVIQWLATRQCQGSKRLKTLKVWQ